MLFRGAHGSTVMMDLDQEPTVNWKIFVLKIFRKKKFRVKKLRSYGWAKLLTRWLKGERSSMKEFGGDCCIRD